MKRISDRFGHDADDLLLKGFAERLQRAIGGSDLAARLGGDEFMVLLPECRWEEVKYVLGHVDGLQLEYEGETICRRFSRGWTDYRPGETAKELLKRAHADLYGNKRACKLQIKPVREKPTVQSV